MRVLSLAHSPTAGPGVFLDSIAAGGHEHVERRVDLEGVPERLDDVDAAIILGGAMNVDEQDQHPWLTDELELVRELHDRGTPVLGVCLGSQVVAAALGGEVGPALRPERGWYEVEVTKAGRIDPLLGWTGNHFRALQWHGQQFAVPPGGVLLARNDACAQAFRAGERTYGIQFHAEVTRESAERWAEAMPEIDPERFRDETARHIGAWNSLGRSLCRHFLGLHRD